MAIVEISNVAKPVAVALDWHVLPGATSERKELDSLFKRTGIKIGCVVTEDDAGMTMVGLSADKKDGVNCGAAWLAKASGGQPLVLVEPLPDGRFWLCAVRAGSPVQGMDIVIEKALLHERLREFLDDGAGDARLCSTLDHLDEVYPGVVPQSFAELVSSVKPERLKRIAGVSPIVSIGGGVALTICLVWYGSDMYLTKMRQLEAQAQLKQMSEMQKQQEAAQIAAAKVARLEAGRAQIRQVVLDKPALAEIVSTYLAVLSDKPLTMAGYELRTYDCAQMACTLTWQRQSGTILGFLTAAESRGWSVDSAQGNDASTVHELNVSSRAATIDELSEDRTFRTALESRLQRAGVSGMKYELSISTPLDKVMGDPPASHLPPGSLDPLPYWVGTLLVKGETFFELRELPDYISHQGLAVSYVRGDIKSKTWTMELNYATR